MIRTLYDRLVKWAASLLHWQEETVYQFTRYIVIGVITACIDVGTFTLLSLATSFPVLLCTTISWAITSVIHFLLNKYWNFRSTQRPVIQQIGTYLVTLAMSYAFMVGCMALFTDVLHINRFIAKPLTSVLNVLWSFPAQKFLTFGKGIIHSLSNRRSCSSAESSEKPMSRKR